MHSKTNETSKKGPQRIMKRHIFSAIKDRKCVLSWLLVSLCGGFLPSLQAANNALSFNGTSSYVTFGRAPCLGSERFTIETWFYRESGGVATSTGSSGLTGTDSAIPLVTKGRGENDAGLTNMNFFLGIRTNGNFLAVDFEDTATGLNHPFWHNVAITPNVWHHAAATYDGDKWRLYLDGVEAVSGSIGATPQSGSIQHAALASALTTTGAAAGYFKGRLDEARIWNYARSAAQINAGMNTEIQSAPGLIGRWALNEGTGTTVNDSSGSAVTGTNINSPTWSIGGGPTINQLPNTPVLGSPADGATGVSTSPTLTATASDPEASSLTVTFYGRPTPADFTIIPMPDTQHYTDVPANEYLFAAQTDWIVQHRIASNIVYVAQLGDCVESGDTTLTEWQVATNAMYRLENQATTCLPYGIPYGIAVGNHDQSPSGSATGTTTNYNQYFGFSHFNGRPYYGGRYGTVDNDNHYDLFSAGGMDWIVIYFEYDTTQDQPILDWANTLLQTHSNRRGIVVSHFILNPPDWNNQGNWSTLVNPAVFGAQGQAIYNALRGNPNLHFTLSGHRASPREARRIDAYCGNKVHSLMSDYQADPSGGGGYTRVMTFSPAKNKIYVRTFSPANAQYPYRDDNPLFVPPTYPPRDGRFDLDYDMQNYGWTVVGTQTGVPSGTQAGVAWNDLAVGTSYQWYVEVSDGTTTARSPVRSFTTSPSATPAVEFLGTDTTTGPLWVGNYGSQGYNVFGDTSCFPEGFESSGITPDLQYDWPEASDGCWYCGGPDGLQKASNPSQTGRYCVHSPDFELDGYFDVDLNFTDGLMHKVSFYVFDFDANYGAEPRVQELELRDAGSGALLHTSTISSFSAGQYRVYNVVGHVTARFIFVGGSYNSVLSGYFIDPPMP